VHDHAALPAISALAVPRPRDRAAPRHVVISAAIIVGAIPFAAYATLVLNHFYISGAFFYDSGLLGFLMWHSGAALATPALDGGASFYAAHISPIFVLLSAISRVLPATMPQFLAGFEGVSHALPALAVFWLLVSAYGMRSSFALLVAAAISIAFAFNGLALAIARYPHFEMLIVGAVLLFVVALRCGRSGWAIVPFILGLATREDAGFDFAALLTIIIAFDWRYGMRLREQKAALAFAAAGLAYSLCAIALQHMAFADASAFARVYVGDPPFAGITLDTIALRLRGYLFDRSYIVLPGLFAVAWAGLARNPYLVAGYIAFLPWLALHLFAASDIAGSLSGYYAYPLMIAAFWPLVGVSVGCDRFGAAAPIRPSLLAFGVMIVLSWTALPRQYNPGHLDLPGSLVSPPSLTQQQATDHAIAVLSEAKPTLGPVLVDGSILALAPGSYTRGETVQYAGPEHPQAVIYFAGGYEAARAVARAADAGLTYVYAVAGTEIRIASGRPLPPLPGLGLTPGPLRIEP
jgi:hypothetical protein